MASPSLASASSDTTILQTITTLTQRIQVLEDTNSIRNLHHTYGYYIDKCLYPSVVSLFSTSPSASVHFLNGIWRGHASISRLYVDWFGTLFTSGKDIPPRGFLLDHLMMQDVVTVEPISSVEVGAGNVNREGRRAKGRFRCFMQGGSHEGVSAEERPKDVPGMFWEGGVYENEYVFEEGRWRIFRLGYNMLWQADYEKGWGGSEAMKGVERCFPEDKWGPDEIVGGKEVWPETRIVPFHYMHPVTGEEVGDVRLVSKDVAEVRAQVNIQQRKVWVAFAGPL